MNDKSSVGQDPPLGRVIHTPIRDLPEDLTQQAHQHVRCFTVSLVASKEDDDRAAIPCAGSLVILNGRAGILTARHVWEAIKAQPVLGVLLQNQHYRIPSWQLDAVAPPPSGTLPGEEGCAVPDLAFIPLASAHRGVLEAKGRAFYNIDQRRTAPAFDPNDDQGFYIAAGTLERLTDRQARAVCSFNYATQVGQRLTHAGWDYLYVALDLEGNPALPETMGGMSGGGVWRVRYELDTHGRISLRDVELVGVSFWETDAPGRRLLAHGPASVYERMLAAASLSQGG